MKRRERDVVSIAEIAVIKEETRGRQMQKESITVLQKVKETGGWLFEGMYGSIGLKGQ